ncbi:MAG TPA: DUF6600 domain-containing protein [Thermoanaerobaculia bacterium]|nr:DUF6600 domain-containing protein [Thermoanaerobaculia bacterium]
MSTPWRTTVFAALFLAAALPALADSNGERDRYGYYRIVEGSATLAERGEPGRQGDSQSVQENQPLVTGDRLWTARGSRVEAVLADNTLLRVSSDSEVGFDELAWSGDADAESNLLTLRRGEVQLVGGGGAETRVDTDNASVYLRDSGTYRIETRDDTTLVVVRNGRAEVRTRRGAVTVDADEEAWIEGDNSPEVQAAGTGDSLERWATNLDDQYRRARWDDDYVDASLSYSSVRMAEYGSWVTYGGRRAWRPRVAADWSPYRHGRWIYTPSGLTWCSYEPWGWVPYHYGSWDYVPNWGWAWYPGRVYAPAWVYWYWGPSYVGWCPFGYYSHYYGPRFYSNWGFGIDFTWGFGRRVHGWAGGSHWDRWNFVDCNGIYDRRLGYRTRSWAQLGVRGALPRGIITTETRGLRPDVATRPSQGMLRLASDHTGWDKPVRELPDVSRFVARDPNVGADVGRWALPVDRDGGVGGRGDRAGNGRWAPGEKPAWVGDENAVGTRRATSNPDWRSGSGNSQGSIGGADPSAARNGRPRGNGDDWRGANVGRAGDEKPSVGGRSAGEKPGAVTPGNSTSGSWRTRPDGNSDRGESARVPGAGVSGRPSRPSPDGSNGRGVEEKPSGATSRGARPSGGDEGWRGSSRGVDEKPAGVSRSTRPGSSDDESWRSSGHEGVSGGRPPVRRIVEGVRSNRGESNDGNSGRSYDRPTYGREIQPVEPSRVEPRASSPRPSAPVYRAEPDRGQQPRFERRSEPQRGGSAGPSRDYGASHGADRGARSDGGGAREPSGGGREAGGSRGGETRPQHQDKDGEPNR